MADENGTTETKKRQRKPPQRRSYATEHAALERDMVALQGRVKTALSLLDKAANEEAPVVYKRLVEIAVETLMMG